MKGRIYGKPGMSPATYGALSELRVSCDLIDRGYSVFRALSPNAPCDLVVIKAHQVLRVEVKSNPIVPCGAKQRNYDILAQVLTNEIVYTPPFEEFS